MRECCEDPEDFNDDGDEDKVGEDKKENKCTLSVQCSGNLL